jgi:hypothetical protein
MPGRKPWTPAQQAAVIEADITRLREQQYAALTRKEHALQDELRGMHQQFAARAAVKQAEDEYDVLTGQIDQQLEALRAIPTQRPRSEPWRWTPHT